LPDETELKLFSPRHETEFAVARNAADDRKVRAIEAIKIKSRRVG
jgi:hypothetical protein